MSFEIIHHGRYNEPVSREELFGSDFRDEGPVFATREEAEMYCKRCENAWPADSEVRDDYDIAETERLVTAKMSVERVHRLVGATQ